MRSPMCDVIIVAMVWGASLWIIGWELLKTLLF
jgi:hypothetical protein